MSRKSRSAIERCAVCGSKLRRKAIIHQEWRKAHLHLVQNVPAQVCRDSRSAGWKHPFTILR